MQATLHFNKSRARKSRGRYLRLLIRCPNEVLNRAIPVAFFRTILVEDKPGGSMRSFSSLTM